MNSQTDILIQYLEGTLSQEDRLQLEQRLMSDPELLAELNVLQTIHQYAPAYTYPETDLTDNAWSEFEQRIKPQTRLVFIRRISAIAASILILAVTGFGLFRYFSSDIKEFTASGQPSLIELEDGSSLILNPGSSIQYNADNFSEKREISASGDITFIVKKNAHPFLVQFEDFNIHVTGTRFRVKTTPTERLITLFSGKLEVSSNNVSYKLKSGESLSGIKIWSKSENKLPDNSAPYYPLEFSNSPLSDVIKNIEKRLDISIKYPPHLKNVRYTLNAEGLSKEEIFLILTELTSTTIEEHSGYFELKQ